MHLNKILKNSSPGKVACIWHIERVQIDAIKFKRTQIHFFFTAVVFVVAFKRSLLLWLIKVTNSSRYSVTERSVYVNFVEQVLMFANPYHRILHSQYLMQLKLSTTATLGTEKSGRCREVAVMGGSSVIWNCGYHLIKMFDPQGSFCKFGKRHQEWRIQLSSFPVS